MYRNLARALFRFALVTGFAILGPLGTYPAWSQQGGYEAISHIADQRNILHPLDPLNGSEIASTVEILTEAGKVQPDTRFALIELKEPPKEVVRTAQARGIIHRLAQASMYDWATRTAAEAVVDLSERRVVSWKLLDTQEPPIIYLAFARAREIVLADPRWHEAMQRRGVTDYSAIGLAPETDMDSMLPDVDGEHVVGVASWVNDALDSEDADLHLDIEVNLTRGHVTSFEDLLPDTAGLGKATRQQEATRKPLKPLSIVQAQGPSFEIEGSQISWQNWVFHYGVNPRRGLELYDVAYRDGERLRSVLYRASISEMVTPYGDPGWGTWYPSDEGDLPIATYSLKAVVDGEDTPPNVVYRSATTFNAMGEAVEIPRAVSIYERDGGLLWRHHNEARRARTLVLSSFVTVDNYDYVFSWIFHQDGSIEVEAALTGTINFYEVERQKDETASVPEVPISHVLVAPGIAGPIHQHFFSYRLDLDVDGVENSVLEMNTSMLPPAADDPSEEWFATEATVLKRELEARRKLDAASNRYWKVINPGRETTLGQHPAYALMPGHNAFPYPGPRSAVRRQMGFLDAHFWVTTFASEEMYAAGKYLNLDLRGGGVTKWSQGNQEVENRDVVVWYTMGITHLPRPEDWPVMPARRESFKLVPIGFFAENPAMDVARPNPWN